MLWKVTCGPGPGTWIETDETDENKVVALWVVENQPDRLGQIFGMKRKGERGYRWGLIEWVLPLLVQIPRKKPKAKNDHKRKRKTNSRRSSDSSVDAGHVEKPSQTLQQNTGDSKSLAQPQEEEALNDHCWDCGHRRRFHVHVSCTEAGCRCQKFGDL